MNAIFYSSVFICSLGVCLSFFISPYFLIAFAVQGICIYFSFRMFKWDLKTSEEVDTFIKIKMDSLLDDVIYGNSNIRAANLETYFGMKLGHYLERRVLLDIYKIGLRRLMSLRVYTLSILTIMLPLYIVIYLTFDEKYGDDAFRVTLLISLVLVPLAPMMGDKLISGIEDLYWHIFEIDDCLALTNFDSEIKVTKLPTKISIRSVKR